MKPTKKELGNKEYSQVITTNGTRFGLKKYENGIRIAINNQSIILRTTELHNILTQLAFMKETMIYNRYFFTLIKEKFPREKGLHRYINKLLTEKPPFFEEMNNITTEQEVLEKI